MKILCTEIESWQEELIKKAFPHDTIFCTQEILSEKVLGSHHDIEVLSIFVDSKVNEAILAKLPQLKLLITRTTGYDNIDLAATSKRDIVVCNDPTYATTAVAEYTFALILELARALYTTCAQVKLHNCFSRTGLCGFELKGKTIGIIGMGNIGKQVAAIAHGFGMRILAFDMHQKPELANELHFTYADLPELLQNADISSMHLPLTQETYHIINSETMRYIKKGAVFINTARGVLVETKALLEALENNTLKGCAVDVLEDPQSPEAKALISHTRALVTPHNAYNTTEAAHRLIADTIAMIKAYKAGKPYNTLKI